MNQKEAIAAGRTALGIEFGSTRIKAVLIGEDSTPLASGSHEWEILRVGADFRLSCMGCAHQVMMERRIVEKNARALTKKAPAQ